MLLLVAISSISAPLMSTDTSVGIFLFRHKLPESSGNTTVCVEVLEETECPIGFILDVILHVTDNTTSGYY